MSEDINVKDKVLTVGVSSGERTRMGYFAVSPMLSCAVSEPTYY